MMGAMQLTILRAWLGGDFPKMSQEIVSSPSWETGGIFARLSSELGNRCQGIQ
jgi:hypothetical protein